MIDRTRLPFWLLVLVAACLITLNAAAAETRVPPHGQPVPDEARAQLDAGVTELGREITSLRSGLSRTPELLRLMPDVEIFHKAADWPLRYDEFYRSNDVATARELLKQGMKRAAELRRGEPSWLSATGLVVRGYRSAVDGSVQPYGLVVPSEYATSQSPRALHLWLHGRDNELTELKFIGERQRSFGEFAPSNAIVLHPYGRYCNAFKFAGETDVFEAMEHVRANYSIDPRRIALRGFSMGGAGVWHLAAHYPHRWAVAAPGAGFAETAEYTGALAKEPRPSAWEQLLWRWYDATFYAANFSGLPVVAYNGTDDKQRQAADAMERAMREAGLSLPRVWGTNTGHKYTATAKTEISTFVEAALARRGQEPPQQHVDFTTATLRYHRTSWLELLGLEQHWRPARVIVDRGGRSIRTTNVYSFAIEAGERSELVVDGQKVAADRLTYLTRERDGDWKASSRRPSLAGRKRPGLQGPIDDAFLESFIFVRGTGRFRGTEATRWINEAMTSAMADWRAQFRGDVRIKNDVDITEADIREHHLILWGTRESNRLLGRIADRIPLAGERQWKVGGRKFDPSAHVLQMIYPNPSNPQRYIVLNSGFTFAEAGAGSNARQTPKLPDFAIRRIADDAVATAGFFNEEWKLGEN